MDDDPWFDAYDRTRQRIDGLLREPDVVGEAPVPACPDWSVRDTAAHLIGLARDVVDENTDSYASREWTGAQIARYEGVPVPTLLDDWAALIEQLRAAPLPPIAKGYRSVGRLIFADASVHEHDLRGALGRSAPDNEAVRLGVRLSVDVAGALLRRPQQHGSAPVVHITATGLDSWSIAHDGAVGEIRIEASAFELWRGMNGRRSASQVEALPWSGDPSPILPYWTPPALPFAGRPVAY
jgi:uncharacterized protein (TIGR03083 family)